MLDFHFNARPSWRELPACSTILNGVARHYHVAHYRTTLSLKAVRRGAARYRTRQGTYLVDASHFLLLNDGQEYALDFAAHGDTETLCPFFQRGLVEHVRHGLVASANRQLDDPAGPGSPLEFCERLYPRTGAVGRRLALISRRLHSHPGPELWLEDQLYGLAADLVSLHQTVNREVASFLGVRAATRWEMYRRLHRARDYIDSCFGDRLTVARIARIACLSPYHFQRLFKQAFACTPMQYLHARRLEVARRLLETTDLPVTSICLEVGFESPSTFSLIFHKRFGQSPRAFRRRGAPA